MEGDIRKEWSKGIDTCRYAAFIADWCGHKCVLKGIRIHNEKACSTCRYYEESARKVREKQARDA